MIVITDIHLMKWCWIYGKRWGGGRVGVNLPLDFLTSTSTAICNGRHAAWYGSLFNTLKKEQNRNIEGIKAYR